MCPRCSELKNADEFSFKFRDRGVRQLYCRTCMAAYKTDWYHRNRDHQIVRVRANRERTRIENLIRMWTYLAEHLCVDCGEADPVVLEFDHLRDKRKNVSYMASSGFTWRTIEVEMAKCEVRCANCHRRRTARVRGFYDAKHEPGLLEEGGVYVVVSDNWSAGPLAQSG